MTQPQSSSIWSAGNSFRSYAQSVFVQRLSEAEKPRHVVEASTTETAWELPISEADFPVASSFNDLSLHLFPEWKVAAAFTG